MREKLESSKTNENNYDLNNNKEINQKLVLYGNQFGSIYSRFNGGFWKRIPERNEHVIEYLMAHNNNDEELTMEKALYESTRSYVQKWTLVNNNNDLKVVSNKKQPIFQVDTDFGRRVQIYDSSSSSSSSWKETVDSNAVLYSHLVEEEKETITRKTFWENTNNRNSHVTLTFTTSSKNDDKKRLIERTERYLQLAHLPNDSQEEDFMVVKRTFYKNETFNISCTEYFQRDLVNEYSPSSSSQAFSSILYHPLQKVPGCIATVFIRVILILQDDMDDVHNAVSDDLTSKYYKVYLDGDADAFVSRGLLSVLSHVLKGQNANDILNLKKGFNDDEDITDLLGLRKVLSKGRNDGLASMLNTVQDQIRNLLQIKSEPEVENEKDENEIKNTDINTQTTQQNQDPFSPYELPPDIELPPKLTFHTKNNNKHPHQPTVAMLLSGGVDSSVALNLLKYQGYNVTAFYLKIWLEDELSHLNECPWEDDFNVCKQVCSQANVPLESISLQQEYKQKVISYTLEEAKKGRTPNPDIMCNSRIKFGCFYDAISNMDFDYVATGHYAALVNDDVDDEKKIMKRAPDKVKDQSYFLAKLTQTQLSRVIFPLGTYKKNQVRELAQFFDLPNKNRPDSQGLCFLGKVKFDEFIGSYLGENPGDIIDAFSSSPPSSSPSETREIVGKHKGLWFHTIGQRKGIGKSLFPLASSRGPWYVVAKDPKQNTLLVSNLYDEEVFQEARTEFFVEDIHWISGSAPKRLLGTASSGRFQMKIRHGPTIVKGSLTLIQKTKEQVVGEEQAEEGEINQGTFIGRIKLDKKDGGLAPGQFVVFYGLSDENESEEEDELECLGSAVISEQHWASFLKKKDISTADLQV